MDELREAAAAMGRVRSAAKTAAVRENGKLGGRPAGTAQSPETRAKIREARLRIVAEQRQAAGMVDPPPEQPKRPRGRPRKEPKQEDANV